jgi:hypothetical protein
LSGALSSSSPASAYSPVPGGPDGFAIVVGSLNFIVELGFVGSARYPLWALTVLALTVVVLYALIVRWDEARLPV